MGENEIDKLFKQQLSLLEVPPSDSVWAGIESGLNASPRKRGLVLLLRWGAVAAVLLLAVFFLHGPGNDPSSIHQLAGQSESESIHSPKSFRDDNPVAESPTLIADSVSQPAVAPERDLIPKPILANASEASKDRAFVHNKSGELLASATKEKVVPASSGADLAASVLSPLMPGGERLMANEVVTAPQLAEIPRDEQPVWDRKALEEFNAREAAQAKAFRLRVKVGGEYSPTYAFREVSGGSPALAGVSYGEDGLMASSGGLKVSIQMHRRWSVETGVRYAMLGQEVTASFNEVRLYSMTAAKEEGLSLRNINLGNSMGAIRTPDVAKSPAFSSADLGAVKNEVMDIQTVTQPDVRADIEQLLGYVEVPLTLRYTLFERGISLSVSGGLSSNWLVGNDAYLYDSGTKRNLGETEGLANMSFSTHAGLAVSMPLYQAFTLQVEPRVSYFLSDISEDYPTSFKPYSFGVFTGIFYSFGK